MCLIRTVIWSQMQPKREAEESKESMTRHHENLRVELVEWGQEEAALRAIREIVFIREQSVPEKLECDGLDPSCAHVLAWNGHGEAIGHGNQAVFVRTIDGNGKAMDQFRVRGFKLAGNRDRVTLLNHTHPSDWTGSRIDATGDTGKTPSISASGSHDTCTGCRLIRPPCPFTRQGGTLP